MVQYKNLTMEHTQCPKDRVNTAKKRRKKEIRLYPYIISYD
jgi:hypothetical protein